MMKAGMAALMTLASVALALPDHAEAHGGTFVSGEVVIQSPVAVFGFSYGNPWVTGHVHHGPVACHQGTLYYYPSYRVYGHRHPGYHYSHYAQPRYVNVAPGYGHGYKSVYRGHGPYGHGHGYYGKRGYHKVRGHDRRSH